MREREGNQELFRGFLGAVVGSFTNSWVRVGYLMVTVEGRTGGR